MAIDTAEKRRSVAGVRWRVVKGVTPNTSKDPEWRQQVGWSYSGIAANDPGTGAADNHLMTMGVT